MQDELKTLVGAIRFFSDPDNCFEAMKQARWPEGFGRFRASVKRLMAVPYSEVQAELEKEKQQRVEQKKTAHQKPNQTTSESIPPE